METQNNENVKKTVLGSVYVNKTAKDKEGNIVELSTPSYQMQLNTEEIAKMAADEEGNIRLSIHERKDSEQLAKEKRPTCYVIENTYAKDKKIDLYSLKDIVVSKDDVLALAKKETIGEKQVEKAYITVTSDGNLMTTTGKYEERKPVKGKGFEVDSVERQMKSAKERMGDQKVSLDTVGIAWKFTDKEGKSFFSVCINDDKAKYLPVDEKKFLQLSLRPMKDVKGEKAPTHVVVPNQEFLNGRLDRYAEMDFQLRKQDCLSDKVMLEEKQTYNGKEYTSHSTYLNVNEEGKVRLNMTKYPGLKESDESVILYGAKATKVDQQARVEEIQKRVEAAKAREEKKEEKTEAKKSSGIKK